ncbi:uncharacterized protein LOC105426835 [Pogonomyrmex barbatus]|uniref:Uncharacterized protein LOC105426835 n=1 Tax=Pogonomyrmex barbatus TaxID=144034 RepID=A0A8N1S7K5_9HYME|nr:uncharacterized protein LOC105426835 [Pogonomyrmex barbatus]
MWCFKGREDLCIYILPNQKKSFGTIQSDIKLEGDITVSKLHSIVSIEITEKSKIEYKCVISDVSKYGTFVTRNKEKKKLPPNDEFILKNGDIVQFGLKESIFVVLCYSFVIAKSNLDEEEMKKLKHIADYLKIKLSETWENFCTHLTVAESTLFTTKLACALASAKPIVTIAYWEAVNTAVKESKELPKIEDFLPRVKEEWLKVYSRLFLPNEKRTKLLKGLLFVHFCAKQYFVYAPLIIAAGGKSCVYPTKRPLTPQDLIAKNAIVIQQPINDSLQLTQDVTTDYSIICDKLKAVKRRMISDTEIPLAVLYCTMEIYCNPKFDFISFLKLKVQTFSPSDIIISENTQDVNINKKQIKKQIIPDTCEIQNENFSKKIHSFVENYKRYIFDVNKNNVTQNIDNEEIRHKIISYDFEIERNILKSAYIFNEDEQKYMFNSSKKNIEMKNMQNNREIKYKISTIVCNSKNNENIFKKSPFFGDNWCERYLDQTFTNEILRKDITCGKKFKKIPVIKPERVLRVDDFAL